jgi:hypothetical protein
MFNLLSKLFSSTALYSKDSPTRLSYYVPDESTSTEVKLAPERPSIKHAVAAKGTFTVSVISNYNYSEVIIPSGPSSGHVEVNISNIATTDFVDIANASRDYPLLRIVLVCSSEWTTLSDDAYKCLVLMISRLTLDRPRNVKGVPTTIIYAEDYAARVGARIADIKGFEPTITKDVLPPFQGYFSPDFDPTPDTPPDLLSLAASFPEGNAFCIKPGNTTPEPIMIAIAGMPSTSKIIFEGDWNGQVKTLMRTDPRGCQNPLYVLLSPVKKNFRVVLFGGHLKDLYFINASHYTARDISRIAENMEATCTQEDILEFRISAQTAKSTEELQRVMSARASEAVVQSSEISDTTDLASQVAPGPAARTFN